MTRILLPASALCGLLLAPACGSDKAPPAAAKEAKESKDAVAKPAAPEPKPAPPPAPSPADEMNDADDMDDEAPSDDPEAGGAKPADDDADDQGADELE